MSRTHKDTWKWKKKVADIIGSIPSQIGNIPSWYKKMRRKSRKAKEKEAFRNGREIPKFKRNDEFDWY